MNKLQKLRHSLRDMKASDQNLINALDCAQKIYGSIPLEAEKTIAQEWGIPLSRVISISSFYHLFRRGAPVKYVIRICEAASCHVNKSQNLIKAFENELGLKPGEFTKDGRIQLEVGGCFGACDRAPALMINDVIYGPVNEEDVPELLNVLNHREV